MGVSLDFALALSVFILFLLFLFSSLDSFLQERRVLMDFRKQTVIRSWSDCNFYERGILAEPCRYPGAFVYRGNLVRG